MADGQLDLFSRKKFTGILPQTLDILPPTTDSTVLQTLPAYHTYLSSGGYSKYTPDDFTSDVKKFGLFIKDKALGEIRTADIQQWIGELKKVLSSKTVSRKVSALSNYFLWLVSVEVFEHKTNPAGAIRYSKVTSPLPDILFETECQALVRAASSDPWTDPQTKTELYTFTIITTVPNPVVGAYHDREPVQLQRELEKSWLNPDFTEPEQIMPMLQTSSPEHMESWHVADEARNPRNDYPEIINPV